MNWYIIKSKTGLKRLSFLLEELNIIENKNPLLYIQLGYQKLSAQDKETYYLIRNIYNLTKNPICKVSVEYLGQALGTKESTQLYRLRNLQQCHLIKIINYSSIYMEDKPYPDSTFLSTLIRLIRRKKLGNLISLYRSCNNPILRMQYLLEINKLLFKGVIHYKLNTIDISSNIINNIFPSNFSQKMNTNP